MNLHGSETGDRYAFIVGHYKAGSTWLLRLLSHHPDIRSLDETQIFRRATHTPDLEACTRLLFTTVPWSGGGVRKLPVYRARKLARRVSQSRRMGGRIGGDSVPGSLLDLPVRLQRSLRARLTRCSTQDAYFRAFFGFLDDHYRPGRYLLEKTPMNIHCVPLIRAVFPGAKLMAIYRDGRDVVVSDKFYSTQMRREWSVEKSAQRWRGAMQAQIDHAGPHGIHTLSYEGLQADGPGEVRKVLRFLGLPTDDATIAEMVERSSFASTTGRRPGDERPDRFNRKGVVGDWRNHFSDEDKAAFRRIAGDLLVKLGYEKSSEW
jgi:hypothetical protein